MLRRPENEGEGREFAPFAYMRTTFENAVSRIYGGLPRKKIRNCSGRTHVYRQGHASRFAAVRLTTRWNVRYMIVRQIRLRMFGTFVGSAMSYGGMIGASSGLNVFVFAFTPRFSETTIFYLRFRRVRSSLWLLKIFIRYC